MLGWLYYQLWELVGGVLHAERVLISVQFEIFVPYRTNEQH